VIKGERKKLRISIPFKKKYPPQAHIHISRKFLADKIEAKFKGGDLIIILPKMTSTTLAIKIRLNRG
jgi:HSP20 family molecular chaperone IbpA